MVNDTLQCTLNVYYYNVACNGHRTLYSPFFSILNSPGIELCLCDWYYSNEKIYWLTNAIVIIIIGSFDATKVCLSPIMVYVGTKKRKQKKTRYRYKLESKSTAISVCTISCVEKKNQSNCLLLLFAVRVLNEKEVKNKWCTRC